MKFGKCFLCGKYSMLEHHHIFGKDNREKSTEYRLIVDVCGSECHREGKYSIHKNKEVRERVQKYGQLKFMTEQYATVQEFRDIFGKNYLDVDDDDNVIDQYVTEFEKLLEEQ